MAKRAAKRRMPVSNSKQRPLFTRSTFAAAVVALLLGAAVLYGVLSRRPSEGAAAPSSAQPDHVAAPQLNYEVVNSYPHDPQAFLQGLVWWDGGFYESTGLYGRSTLRRVEFPSGKVLKSINLSPDLFGEGLAMVNNRLIQLEWKSGRGFVYDRDTFALAREFKYNTEGWGITYDGQRLVMSDGSSNLFFLDPNTFEVIRKLPVTMNGRPVNELNELEFIEGEIWSNVWQTDLILRINPETGRVNSYLDLKGILPASMRTGSEDVLNGIAYDPQQKRIFVCGKKWPRLFEIRIK